MNVTASAPGKIILFGEHFVIYGSSAVLCAISRRVTVTISDIDDIISIKSQLGNIDVNVGTPINDVQFELRPMYYIACNILDSIDISGVKIEIESDIPPGAGLGSSSACCVAAASAAFTMLKRVKEGRIYRNVQDTVAAASMVNGTIDNTIDSKKDLDGIIEYTSNDMTHDTINYIINTAISAERTIFPDTSGMDCIISARGGLGIYDGTFNRIDIDDSSDINIKHDILFIVADSNVPHNTRDMVDRVKRYKNQNPIIFDKLRRDVDDIVREVPDILVTGDYSKLGMYMNKNHQYLRDIGVSNDTLDEMVQLGSVPYGAKITGAGGGGCTCAITDATAVQNMIDRYAKKNYKFHVLDIDDDGLIVFN